MIFDSAFNKFMKDLERQRDNYKHNSKVLYTEGQIRNIYDNLINAINEINTTGYLDVEKYYEE